MYTGKQAKKVFEKLFPARDSSEVYKVAIWEDDGLTINDSAGAFISFNYPLDMDQSEAIRNLEKDAGIRKSDRVS